MKVYTYFGLYPAALEGVVDDGALDVLDGDGRLRDAQHTRALARGRTHATRELCATIVMIRLYCY